MWIYCSNERLCFKTGRQLIDTQSTNNELENPKIHTEILLATKLNGIFL